LILKTVSKQETSNAIKEQVLKSLTQPDFLRIFVKNLQNSKSPLTDAANEIKKELMVLAKAELSSKTAFELL